MKDLAGLERQSLEGAGFGFTGKQVIHPGQISTVQQAFTPPIQRIEWATQLIKVVNTLKGRPLPFPNRN